VKTTTTTITEMPQLSGKSFMRCLATNTQKVTTGAMMRNIVRNTDLTSGPNMNLPCKKNSCRQQRHKMWNAINEVQKTQLQKTAVNMKYMFANGFRHFFIEKWHLDSQSDSITVENQNREKSIVSLQFRLIRVAKNEIKLWKIQKYALERWQLTIATVQLVKTH